MPSELEMFCQASFSAYLSNTQPDLDAVWQETHTPSHQYELLLKEHLYTVHITDIQPQPGDGLCEALKRTIKQRVQSMPAKPMCILLLPHEFVNLTNQDYQDCFQPPVDLPKAVCVVYLVETSSSGQVIFSNGFISGA